MLTRHSNNPAAQMTEVKRLLASLIGSCFGCADCKGSCAALVEMIAVPEIVLSKVSHA